MVKTTRKPRKSKVTKKGSSKTRKYSDGIYTYHDQFSDEMIADVEVADLKNKGWKVRTTKGADTGAFGYMAFDRPTIIWKRSNKRKTANKRTRK